MRVWRNFLTFIGSLRKWAYRSWREWYPFDGTFHAIGRYRADTSSALPNGAAGLAKQDFGTARDQKIRHGADLAVALFLVKVPGLIVEIRHAGEQVLRP